MPEDRRYMACPQCKELIPRWFTYHTCGWHKPGVTPPVETKEPEVVKTMKPMTIKEMTEKVEREPDLNDIWRTLEGLATCFARIEQITQACLENQSAIIVALTKLLKVHGETVNSTLRLK